MFVGFLFGSLFWLVVFVILNHKWIKPQIKSKRYASVRYDKLTKQWRVIGDIDHVMTGLNEARHNRPGSVKYVD